MIAFLTDRLCADLAFESGQMPDALFLDFKNLSLTHTRPHTHTRIYSKTHIYTILFKDYLDIVTPSVLGALLLTVPHSRYYSLGNGSSAVL